MRTTLIVAVLLLLTITALPATGISPGFSGGPVMLPTMQLSGTPSAASAGVIHSHSLPLRDYLPLINRTLTRPGVAYLVWTVEDLVQSPSRLGAPGEHSLRLDSQGQARIAFGGDRLYYAYQDGQSWRRQLVDKASGSGSFASLALTVDDQPRISYFDQLHGVLKYAAWTDGAWNIQIVDDAGRVGTRTSLEIDRSGSAHICYFDETYAEENKSALKYATWMGSGWQKEVVDATLSLSASCSLALDANDAPAIAYYDWRNHDLKYAHRTTTGWLLTAVDSEGEVGELPSLAMGVDGSAHISYADTAHHTLKYARLAGGSWHIVGLAASAGPSSVALDYRGFPIIGFASPEPLGIGITRWDGAAWQSNVVWTLADGDALFISLALGDGDEPQLAYYHSEYEELVHLQPSGPSWAAQQIVSFESVWHAPSLVLGRDDLPHVAYGMVRARSGLAFDVYEARLIDGKWTSEHVASEQNYGFHTSMALDGNDSPHLIYLVSSIDGAVDVHYAYQLGGQWRDERVATTIYGGHGALALDAEGGPQIVFDGPEYAHKAPDGNWLVEPIGLDVGVDPALAIDSQGRPHVIFYSGDWGVRYGWRDETGWHLQTIAGAGRWCSLKLNKSDSPRFACQDEEGNIRFGSWTGSYWSIQVVEWMSGLKYDDAPSLALDHAGKAHICYGDESRGMLKYASQTATSWNVYAVDTDGHIPGICSLDLTSQDLPVIAYLERLSWDLKYATAAVLSGDDTAAAQFDAESLPDLVVQGMGIELETGGSCNFTSTQLGTSVGIANIGDAGAGAFVVQVNGQQRWVEAGLGAGERIDLWFPGYQTFTETVAIADATGLVTESSEENNESRLILGIPTLPATCTPTPTPSPTITPTASGTITVTPTPTPSHTPTLTPTITPSPSPIATGDFWWRCEVGVRDANTEQPIAGAQVLASAIGQDACTTGAEGVCVVRVLAHDTGRARLEVSAANYKDFAVEYVGFFAPSWQLVHLIPEAPPITPTETPTESPTPPTPTPTETPTIAAPPTDTPTPSTALLSIWMPMVLRFPPAPVWQIETVDGTDGAYVGGLVSLALDPDQRPAISYVDRDAAQLKFARSVQVGGNCGFSGDWQCDPIAPAASGPVWVSSSLAFDSAGRPHIAYPSAGGGTRLMVAQFVESGGNCGSASTWSCQLIDDSSWFGWVSMALDASGAAHVSYADFGKSGVKYAHFAGASGNCGPNQTWQCDMVVHAQTQTWMEHSLALDVNGIPYIAYTQDGLRLARYRGANGNCGPAQDWQCDLIDATSSGNVVLRFDADNHPHIAYLHEQGVNYAHWVGGGGNCGPALSWQCDIVDISTWVGWGLALAFDPEGQPHLSYQAIREQDLRYARYVGIGGNCGPAGQWDCRTVDSDGDLGYVTSLAIDEGGRVHIGYLDGMNGDLKYAVSLP